MYTTPMNVKPTANIFFLEWDSVNNNDNKRVSTNKLQGLNPSTKATKNVKIGKGNDELICSKESGETFFKKINVKIITKNTNVET